MQGVGYPDGAGMNALQREIDETRQKSEFLRQKMAQTFEELGRPISVEQYDKLQRELVQSKDDILFSRTSYSTAISHTFLPQARPALWRVARRIICSKCFSR